MSGAPRSFVVLYAGREGSSALIEHLRGHDDIYIAGFEHLDRHSLLDHFDNPNAEIAALLDAAVQRGEMPDRPLKYAGEPVIGFKWRPFGGDEATEVLRRNGTQVVFLIRRDAMDRALSMVSSPQHLQFTVAKMGPRKRAAAIAANSEQHFVVDPADIAESIDVNTRKRQHDWDLYCWDHAGTHVVSYEDFLADPLTTINGIVEYLDLDPLTELPATRFVKTSTGSITERCDNYDEVMADPDVRAALDRHRALLEAIDARHATTMPRWARTVHRTKQRLRRLRP